MESNIVFHWSKDLTLLLYQEKKEPSNFPCFLFKKVVLSLGELIFVSITVFSFVHPPVTGGKIQKQQKCFSQIYGFSYLSVTE